MAKMHELKINYSITVLFFFLQCLVSNAQQYVELGKANESIQFKRKSTQEAFAAITIKASHEKSFERIMDELGIKYQKLYPSYYRIDHSSEGLLESLRKTNLISYIGLESEVYNQEARVLDLNLVANQISLAKFNYPSIRGNESVIHVKEPPVDDADVDLLGRVKHSADHDEINRHATAMATIIGGSGLSSIRGLGVMPRVNFVSSDLSNFFPDQQSFYDSLDIDVENHSYGTSIENFYGARASAFDEHLYLNPKLVTVFSAGNQGLSIPESGNYAGVEGVANLTGNFKMSKNSIVVGAVDTIGLVIPFNSSGPAYDGRIKPDLVAYSMEGTSNAAALVSGSAAFLQELYDSIHGAKPTASLIKALLINGAEDVHHQGPDFKTGFGNLNLNRSAEQLVKAQFHEGTLSTNDSIIIDLPISNRGVELKLSLVWIDMAAEPNSTNALINDLDVRVIDPNGQTRLPLAPDARREFLFEDATEKEDHLNNVEQIVIKSTIEGVYQIVVRANELQSANQDYSLVYAFDAPETFEWLYPFESANMPFNGETVGYIRWQTNLPDEQAELSYRIKGGNEWTSIGQSSLALGKYRWDPPAIYGAAQIRMVTPTKEFYTDFFNISRPLPFLPSVVCGDSIRFELAPQEGIERFIYKAFDESGNVLGSSTFNADLTISSEQQALKYLTISPEGIEGESFLKSDLLTLDELSGSCYLNLFFSEVKADSGVVVTAELGSIAGLESIELLREGNRIAEIGNAKLSTQIKLVDNSPLIGRNLHQMKLNLSSGQTILSEELVTYYLPENRFLVFPNPIERGERLIFYQTSLLPQKAILYVNDTKGNNFLVAAFEQEQLVVDTSILAKGVYVYSIVSNGQRSSGKLIVN